MDVVLQLGSQWHKRFEIDTVPKSFLSRVLFTYYISRYVLSMRCSRNMCSFCAATWSETLVCEAICTDKIDDKSTLYLLEKAVTLL